MRALAFAATLLVAGSAHGLSGVVTGAVDFPDSRSNPYRAAGYSNPVPSGARLTNRRTSNASSAAIPQNQLQRAVVRARITNSAGQIFSFYTRTTTQGLYTLSWFVPDTYPVLLFTIDIIAARPDMGTETVTSAPSYEYQIGDSVVVLGTKTLSPFTGNRTKDFSFTSGGQTIFAFSTAQEMWDLFIEDGAPAVGDSTRLDMQGLRILVNSNITSGGTTVSDSRIELGPGEATLHTLAHEIGHALVFRSLNLESPPIYITDYDFCFLNEPADDGGRWGHFSRECERVAFHEGIAQAIAVRWMWHEDAAPAADTPTGLAFGHFPIDVVATSSDPPNIEFNGSCDSDGASHKRPFCVTRAIWDIMDNPPADDDGIQNRDLSDIVTALRNYPQNCALWATNTCAEEGWQFGGYVPDVDGNNWRDFRSNFTGFFGQSSQLNAIEDDNGLDACDSN